MLHYSAEYSDMDFNNKEYSESHSVCMYNIYTVYERVPVHWTLVRRIEIRDSEQQD